MFVVAIIPAYNEAKRIEASIKDALHFVDAVIVVDDHSTDQTIEIARAAGAYTLHHVVNRGQGAALQTGVDFALQRLGADILVHFDADGQMQGEDIPRLIAPIQEGKVDVALGSRFLENQAKNMPWTRLLTLRLATWFTVLFSGISVTDTHNGFRALSRKAAEQLQITLNRMAHASQILDQIKVKQLSYQEVAVTIRYTDDTLEKGQSSLGGFVILKDLFKDRFFSDL